MEILKTRFEVVISFLNEETAKSAADRITRDHKYIVHVREVAT